MGPGMDTKIGFSIFISLRDSISGRPSTRLRSLALWRGFICTIARRADGGPKRGSRSVHDGFAFIGRAVRARAAQSVTLLVSLGLESEVPGSWFCVASDTAEWNRLSL